MSSRSALPRRRLPVWVRRRCQHPYTVEERRFGEARGTVLCTSCGAAVNHKS